MVIYKCVRLSKEPRTGFGIICGLKTEVIIFNQKNQFVAKLLVLSH